MRVADVMNRQAARLRVDDPLRLAAELLALSQASDLAVVDEDGQFVGVLSEGDLLRALMPDYTLLEDMPVSVADASAFFATTGISRAEDPIGPLVITESISVHPDDDLLKPAAVMVTKQIRQLPVLENGRFVGTLSRADVCWALLIDVPEGHVVPS
ncbi:MAG: CBS domain-containing protein [Euzebya sp.]